MKLTPAQLFEAPSYYVDHFHAKYSVDKVVVLRDGDFISDREVLPKTLEMLPEFTRILDMTNNCFHELPSLQKNNNLHTLLVSRNKISKIDGSKLPKNLVCLALALNNIEKLDQLIGLKSSPRTLRNLNLRGNVVCHLSGYRERIVSYCPQLEILDGERVKKSERIQAGVDIQSGIEIQDCDSEISNVKDINKDLQLRDHVVTKMDKKTIDRIKEQLASASTLEEIERVEKLLSGGV